MSNNLQYAQLFQKNLDEVIVHQSITGWMEGNAKNIIYDGGNTVKVPRMSVQGLADYDRSLGYVDGDVTLSYETFTFRYDRGRKFSLDAMDVNETNFVVNASSVMGSFQKEYVAPEIDAIRISTLAQAAIKGENVLYSYTPAKTTIVEKIKDGITNIRDKGFVGELVIMMPYSVKTILELGMVNQLSATTFNVGGVDTQVPAIDGCPIIPMPSYLSYTAFDIKDGKSKGQTNGGFDKNEKALAIQFMIVARTTPVAISKTDTMRIFDPMTNQKANAWSMDYRKYHDIWVMDNKVNTLYLAVKEAKPQA